MSPTEKRFDSNCLWNSHEMYLIIVYWKECIKTCVAGISHKTFTSSTFYIVYYWKGFLWLYYDEV